MARKRYKLTAVRTNTRYSFCYKNRDERRGGGIGIYIKDTIKYKERQNLSKLDETIEHNVDRVSREEQKKNYLVGVFYQPRSEDKEILIWSQKLGTIPSAITATWNKTIVIDEDTKIDYSKPSTVLGVKTIDHIVSN